MRIIISLLSLLLTLPSFSASSSEPLLVVVNKSAPIEALSKSEVIDIFMGKYAAYNNGLQAEAVDLKGTPELKATFYDKLLGRSLASVNAYWARLKFSGRKRQVELVDSESEIASYIANTNNGIGYITAKHMNDNLKVVYVIDQ